MLVLERETFQLHARFWFLALVRSAVEHAELQKGPVRNEELASVGMAGDGRSLSLRLAVAHDLHLLRIRGVGVVARGGAACTWLQKGDTSATRDSFSRLHGSAGKY